jgi:uncharacterized membrane protein YecN with MAPEG domain
MCADHIETIVPTIYALDTFALPALVTALALLLFMVLTFLVGRARGKYKVPAPAVTGPIEFERVYRTQVNTLEQLAIFLPSLWLFSVYLNEPKIAAALGFFWIAGRILYARAYYAGRNRFVGFLTGLLSASILLIGGITGIAMRLQ